MSEDNPINFEHIAESFELAMKSHESVPDEVVDEIIHTVDEACANNEQALMWEGDYEEFVSVLDGVLDSLSGNGYDEQIKKLDDLQRKLEPKQ